MSYREKQGLDVRLVFLHRTSVMSYRVTVNYTIRKCLKDSYRSLLYMYRYFHRWKDKIKDTPRNRREDHTVRTPSDHHTVLVIQAESSHENNEETQNLNQGNTNENENPSKSSSLCGMCIIFFLFYLMWEDSYDKLLSKLFSSLLLAIQLSNTEPVVYTPSQPDDLNPTIPTYWRYDPSFRTAVRILSE